MAYPIHYLCSFGGPLRGDEIWNMNIRFINSGDITDAGQDACAAAAKTHIQAWGNAAGSGWSSMAALSYVKFNRIGGDGRYTDTGATHRVDFAPANMSATASAYPNQVSMVVSWMTQFARGPGSRGRVFLPVPYFTLSGSTNRWSSANLTTAANAAAGFLNAMNTGLTAAASGDTEASVVSAIDEKKGRITRVRIGDVPDTQRRRRNAYPEVYVLSSTLVTDL